MRILLLTSLLFCFLSCKKEAETQEQSVDLAETSFQISKDDIAKLNFTEFILDAKAGKLLESWQKYYELDNIINNVNQANLSFFKDNNEILVAFIEDLKTTIPERMDSPLIKSRLIALETKMFKLEGVVNLSKPQKKEVLLVVKELLAAFSNLNLQINKKIEKESQNIQKPY
ncbi:hypothetical protein ACFS5M_01740 [Lacinutrix iliipiscaria]|uniref:Uncharacterized protein n=1 Tax=Lacinutrix iliipiscaria TaxID=1230532 RepID=A0ABW5WMH1_9FLAO